MVLKLCLQTQLDQEYEELIKEFLITHSKLFRTSKHLIFHSFHNDHIKQKGANHQNFMCLFATNLPCQPKNNSLTALGSNHKTLNNENMECHKLQAITQWFKIWFADSSSPLQRKSEWVFSDSSVFLPNLSKKKTGKNPCFFGNKNPPIVFIVIRLEKEGYKEKWIDEILWIAWLKKKFNCSKEIWRNVSEKLWRNKIISSLWTLLLIRL